MNRVTLTEQAVRRILTSSSTEPHVLAFPAGLSRLMDRTEWLVHSAPHDSMADGSRLARVVVARAGTAAGVVAAVRTAMVTSTEETSVAALGLGVGPAAGSVAGLVRTLDGEAPLDVVTFLVRGIPSVELSPQAVDPSTDSFWSRTVGALGEAGWRRLRQLHVGVVGCGRSGTLAITALSRLGLQITAIDPDRVEAHNLGEMPVLSLADLGRAKTDAVRDGMTPLTADALPAVTSLSTSVTSLSALAAIKRADVIVCCVDSAAPRLAAAALATAYCKPLLDVGTGIFLADRGLRRRRVAPARRMGADVRMVLPGSCLLCCGGVNGLARARTELLAGSSPRPEGREDWRTERSGSLLSLNSIAVNLGLRLLEDLVGGRVGSSVWLHLEFDDAGIPVIESRLLPLNPACALCAATACGDQAVRELREILNRV